MLLVGAIGVRHALAQRDGDHPHAGWEMGGGMPFKMIEHRADHLLAEVDATSDQQARVHAIIEAAAVDLAPIKTEMRGTREELIQLLTAPQIDRNALETLRTQRQADMDQLTKRASVAMEEAADVLTPEQRTKLRSFLVHAAPTQPADPSGGPSRP